MGRKLRLILGIVKRKEVIVSKSIEKSIEGLVLFLLYNGFVETEGNELIYTKKGVYCALGRAVVKIYTKPNNWRNTVIFDSTDIDGIVKYLKEKTVSAISAE